MRLVQRYPDHRSPVQVPGESRVACQVPVFMVRYRYPHHAEASGYDRLCDYIGEAIRLSRLTYLLGETVLRLPAKLLARYGGQYEYSRYDCVMEIDAIRHFLNHHDSAYHFIYAEKSYRLMAHFAGRKENKLIGTFHHPPEHREWLFRSDAPFRKLDAAVVVSRTQIPMWEEIVGKGKVFHVPYAVDVVYFSPLDVRDRKDESRCVFIGHHERDFECLAQVVGLVQSKRPKVVFHLVSKDERCGRIADRHAGVIWHKRVDDREYVKLLKEADVLVLPLKTSTTNTAVLEAMACGIPIITNRGGIEDYLNPESSAVLPVGDAEGMAGAVCDILSNPEQLREMSKQARLRACEFSWENAARKMSEVYERVTGRTRRGM